MLGKVLWTAALLLYLIYTQEGPIFGAVELSIGCMWWQERLDLDVEVVSGFEEARLIYLGVLQVPPLCHLFPRPTVYKTCWATGICAFGACSASIFHDIIPASRPGSLAGWHWTLGSQLTHWCRLLVGAANLGQVGLDS